MGTARLGPWRPLAPTEVATLLRSAPFRWYLAGGHALELAVGRAWREHGDIDVGVRRDQLRAVRDFLADWHLHVAAAGRLTPWDGRPLTAARHENNVWGRGVGAGGWQVDLVVGAGDDEAWRSRRDPSIALPWADALRRSGRVPYLAPHVQLLMKSTTGRDKDDLDAEVVVPHLEEHERRWLAARLGTDHPWQRLLRRR